MLTLAALVLFIYAFVIMKTSPIYGFLVICLSVYLGGKAVRRPDDIAWFTGICLGICGIYTIYLFASKIARYF